jgi:glyoxylase-like metal-dependent hydrolase (beta-lactamase superfamily II)
MALAAVPIGSLLARIPEEARLDPPPGRVAPVTSPQSATRLELVQYVADSTAFHVNSVLIVGETEALLIDAQYHVEDAQRVADEIAATGKRLKAIFITHPDHDHYSGAAVIVERFPGTPVYMTAAALERFDSTGVADFDSDRARQPDLFADSVIAPRLLPSTSLTVDGEIVEIIPDLQGDVITPVNSVVWIPSLRTLIASDLVFNSVHAWLGASDVSSRMAWRGALRRLAERNPTTVIAGHKPTVDTPDGPETLQTMRDYLVDFDEALAASSDGRELANKMRQKYAWKVPLLLSFSARMAYRQR